MLPGLILCPLLTVLAANKESDVSIWHLFFSGHIWMFLTLSVPETVCPSFNFSLAQSIFRLRATPLIWAESRWVGLMGGYLNVFTEFTTSPGWETLLWWCAVNLTSRVGQNYICPVDVFHCVHTSPGALSCLPIFWLYEKIVFAQREIKIKLKFFHVGWQNKQ